MATAKDAWDDRRLARLDGPRSAGLHEEESFLSYLTCPTCRLTVYRPLLSLSEDCPRCRAKMGKASRLFQSQVPPRLVDPRKGPAAQTEQQP